MRNDPETLITKKFYVEHMISFRDIEGQSGDYLLRNTNTTLLHEFLQNSISMGSLSC